ncbi:MAG: EAL domain-containing protein [Moraxellaceae bacterium]|nr:EAL domain-containing protein [Moraxellaceae bacterium]
MEQQNAKLKDRIRSVQRHFIAKLPSQIEEIKQHWKNLRYVSWEHERVVELQTIAHRLAGSGGTLQLVEWLRQSGIIADYVNSPRDSWLKVKEFKPDVLVLDIRMPECNGIEFATMLRQDIETSQLPIVFLTSENAERTRRQAMAAGADDYLLKPIEKEAFIHAVKVRARLSQRLQGQVNRIIQQAPQGAGLSRHFFFNQFEQALDAAKDGALQAALVLVGLVQSVEELKQQSPVALAALQEQLLVRVGDLGLKTWSMLGDNMIGVLLPKDTISSHQATVKNILKQLSSQPYQFNHLNFDSQMSAAVLYLGGAQTAANTLLLQAEHMLGMAIESGAGTVLEGASGAAKEAEATGKLAVSRLRMLYQPIVTIADSSDPVSSVLVRLADAEGNLLPAGQFLDVVEQRGWMPELDAWVFNNAHHILTEQLASEAAQCLIVHASPVSLNSTVYLETVCGLLATKPMRHERQRLVIAIPEAAAVTHRQQVEKLNQALLKAGCGLMLTGFGASTASIKILHYLQPLYVRLDHALIKRLEQSQDIEQTDQELLNAIAVAKSTMVADGIENAKSMSGLWARGIRWFQGYFIHEPVAELGVEIEG